MKTLRLISPTEPVWLRATASKVNMASEAFGCDILLPLYKAGVQRKEIRDFVSSVESGRLAQQIQMMRGLTWKFLLIEGKPKWSLDGEYMGDKWSKFNKKQLTGLMISIQNAGVIVLQAEDATETLRVLEEIEHYLAKPDHKWLNTRAKQGLQIESGWHKPDDRDWLIFLLQGLPGISVTLARRMVDTLGTGILTWSVTEEQLRTVPGLGNGKVKKLMSTLSHSTPTRSTSTLPPTRTTPSSKRAKTPVAKGAVGSSAKAKSAPGSRKQAKKKGS